MAHNAYPARPIARNCAGHRLVGTYNPERRITTWHVVFDYDDGGERTYGPVGEGPDARLAWRVTRQPQEA